MGTSLISRKGVDLEKGGVWTPLTTMIHFHFQCTQMMNNISTTSGKGIARVYILYNASHQLQRQLGVGFSSTWYYMARKSRLVMNWYNFTAHEYSFFNGIVICLIVLKIFKSQKILGLCPPGLTPSKLCLRP